MFGKWFFSTYRDGEGHVYRYHEQWMTAHTFTSVPRPAKEGQRTLNICRPAIPHDAAWYRLAGGVGFDWQKLRPFWEANKLVNEQMFQQIGLPTNLVWKPVVK